MSARTLCVRVGVGLGALVVAGALVEGLGSQLTATDVGTTQQASTTAVAHLKVGNRSKKKLKRHKGNLTIKKAGTVIDGYDVRGFVVIAAPKVTIRNSVIRGGTATGNTGLLSISSPKAKGYKVLNTTLKPTHPSVRIDGIKVNQKGTLSGLDISGTVDGIVVYGSGVTIQRTRVHDLRTYAKDPNQGGGKSHSDTIQVQSGANIRIEGNDLSGANNAAIQLTQDTGAISKLTIRNNVIDGGGCSINFGSAHGKYGAQLNLNNNRFGSAQRNKNCAIIANTKVAPLQLSNNRWLAGNRPVVASRGA